MPRRPSEAAPDATTLTRAAQAFLAESAAPKEEKAPAKDKKPARSKRATSAR